MLATKNLEYEWLKQIITLDPNPDLELRLQAEIESNQKMALMMEDVIMACNDKLLTNTTAQMND